MVLFFEFMIRLFPRQMFDSLGWVIIYTFFLVIGTLGYVSYRKYQGVCKNIHKIKTIDDNLD
jgi:hypothetical protein